MSAKKFSSKNITWIDIVDPSKKDIDELEKQYKFHELDKEALLEENQRARVDTYDDYIFVVLHFPRYDVRSKRYVTDEFNIFLSKKYIISVRYFASNSINSMFDSYGNGKVDDNEINPGYILYDMIDVMLDKVFRLLDKTSRDLRNIEGRIFQEAGKDLISELMIKKRNSITLRHMLSPQIQVLKMLEIRTNSLFKDEFEVYFENLIDKLEKTSSEILIMQENIESMEDTLKSIFDMQTNISVKYLTIFSAFMLPLTLVTGFFGMNLRSVPFNDILVYSIFSLVIVIMIILLLYFIKNKKL
ncbi:MAG: magnesium transporter CorA family protein [Candidatus Gracilibacteria bacterium]|nr:magnesium transporter CorA family protein [Candidatus Gracilibacteria bacterium]MDD2908546.1 magnesium transporter CorA family protein [Candidatus Gracilibacteria bacterium]